MVGPISVKLSGIDRGNRGNYEFSIQCASSLCITKSRSAKIRATAAPSLRAYRRCMMESDVGDQDEVKEEGAHPLRRLPAPV